MIWVHVSLPPTEDHPAHVVGKTPSSALTNAQLRSQKVETLQYCVAFAYAVKHYLREEDGLDYEDYAGVLPASFTRPDELGYSTRQGRSSPTSYAATSPVSDGNGSNSKPDATKRIRRKRSKKLPPQATVSGATTPLLSDSHQTIEFHPYADRLSMPLPLMFVAES
jgi:ion channel-forming bestrophin family protein